MMQKCPKKSEIKAKIGKMSDRTQVLWNGRLTRWLKRQQRERKERVDTKRGKKGQKSEILRLK